MTASDGSHDSATAPCLQLAVSETQSARLFSMPHPVHVHWPAVNSDLLQ